MPAESPGNALILKTRIFLTMVGSLNTTLS